MADTWEKRREAVVNRAEALARQYQSLFEDQVRRSELSVVRAKELENDILSALTEITHVVGEHEITTAEEDRWN